jgi:hypothetical protein
MNSAVASESVGGRSSTCALGFAFEAVAVWETLLRGAVALFDCGSAGAGDALRNLRLRRALPRAEGGRVWEVGFCDVLGDALDIFDCAGALCLFFFFFFFFLWCGMCRFRGFRE